MSRRGRSGPTISLFSFQDIITSVTAIVTVITLLLALDLVQRKQSKAGDSSGNLAVELVARLAAAEVELAELNAVAGTTDDLVREVAATSPAELRNEIAERQSAIVELERERTRLERQRGQWKTREKQAQTEQFDLEPVRKQQANALAGGLPTGHQRLLELARVLISRPSLILLDEPAAGLSGVEIDAFRDRLLELRKKGLTILLVEHNQNLVMSIADRVTVLDYGGVIAEGTAAEIQVMPNVIAAYLGADYANAN